MNLAAFLIDRPDDVLSHLFEMCSVRDVVNISGLTRGVSGVLRKHPCEQGVGAGCARKAAQLVSAHWPSLAHVDPFVLRSRSPPFPPPLSPHAAPSLPVGPLFAERLFYSFRSANFDTLRALTPGSVQAVEDGMTTLCNALEPAFGVPAADVRGALVYALVQPQRPADQAAADPHDACCKYHRNVPERTAHLVLNHLEGAAAAAGGMQLYMRVAEALRCEECGMAGGAERQCARCGQLLCASCSIRCSRDTAGGCAYALCSVCDSEHSVVGQRPTVDELDELLGLAQPLCQYCGDEPVCPLHQCLVTSECDSCLGMRCNAHVLDHPAQGFCSADLAGCLGRHCDAPACVPAAGRIKHCSHCYSSFCASCFPQMQRPCPGGGEKCGLCLHCYQDDVCPGCGRPKP